jgi:Major Facilitator Superfamily
MSWLVAVESGSAAEVGAMFALRMAPLVIVGPIAGALADTVRRGTLLAVTNLLGALVYGCLAVAMLGGRPMLLAVWIAALFLGTFDAVRLASMGSLVVDAAPPTLATAAIATSQIASRIGAGLGGFAIGVLLAAQGAASTFAVAAVLNGLAALLLVGAAGEGPVRRMRQPLRGAIADGVGLLVRNRKVRLLALIAVVAEVFGFSNDGILPIFAAQILGLGSGGLGLLYLAVRFGSVAGLLVLIRSGTEWTGRSLVGLTVTFGIALAAFGLSGMLGPSLVFLAIAGGSASSIDALEQSLMQGAVDETERGRAMGVWTICLGFGPIGFIALGAMAVVVGAPAAQVIAGVTMALVGVILWRSADRFRLLAEMRARDTGVAPATGLPA